MRTPLFLSSLETFNRAVRRGVTLGLAATLLVPAACDTQSPVDPPVIDPNGVTTYTALSAPLSSEAECIQAATGQPEGMAAPHVDMGPGSMEEPRPTFIAARAPRSLARHEASPWRSGRSSWERPPALSRWSWARRATPG